MIGTLFKALVGGLIVLVITGLIGLVIMAGVASTHDVVRIPVPESSYLAGEAARATYADAYRAPLEYNTYRTIERVIENADHKGKREVFRDEKEVVYEGTFVGITYRLSYLLERSTSPHTLTTVTTVRVVDSRGRYLLAVLRPIHRRFAPYMLDRLAQSATD